MKTPQPFPYQGSKRNLATAILRYVPIGVGTLIEPFAGSAAITIAAAANNLTEKFAINDFNQPLIELWCEIINRPEELARRYESLWREQHADRRRFYDDVRDKFNQHRQSDHLLYLLARCVKASVRYNADGGFNQSPDNRRNGILPDAMRKNLLATSSLLRGRTECSSLDYKEMVARATTEDLVYMDPPYQGVCGEREPRMNADGRGFNRTKERLFCPPFGHSSVAPSRNSIKASRPALSAFIRVHPRFSSASFRLS